MNVKMNTDFLKNITLPPIQLPKMPKMKTRKIFTSATAVTTQQRDTAESKTNNNLLHRPKPQPLVASPAKISTLSQLVDGAPTYDYSFGGATVPEHMVDRIAEDEESQSKPKSKSSTEKLSKRISKQYKELSEFKLKDIFGKKTVVRTTEIQQNIYIQPDYEHKTTDNRYCFKRSDSNDDTDIEIETVTDRYEKGTSSSAVQNQPIHRRRKFGSIKQLSEESTSSLKWSFPKAASLQVLSGIKPNESSLWKIKKSKSNSSSAVDNADGKDLEENKTKSTDKRSRLGRRTLSRQDFDAAFDKAKKSVNSKIRQFKFLQSRQLGSRDSQKSTRKPTVSAPIEIIDRRGSFDSFDSEKQLPEADLAVLRDEWITRRIVSCEEIPRCLLGPQDSVDEEAEAIAQVCILNGRTAEIPSPELESSIEELNDSLENNSSCHSLQVPAIPTTATPPPQQWMPNSQIIVAFYQATASVSPPARKGIFPEFPRGHSRKPSMDSTDSDSWIPEKLRGKTRSQAGLNKIDESSGAWRINDRACESQSKFIKMRSIDIFQHGGEEVFEDFEKVLRNVPVITVKKDSFDYNEKPYDQRSVDFSTTDEDEDDIDPDISTVVESPQELSTIREMHRTKSFGNLPEFELKNGNTVSEDSKFQTVCEVNDNATNVADLTPPETELPAISIDEKKLKVESYIPQYPMATIISDENKQFELNPVDTFKNSPDPAKEQRQSSFDKNQNLNRKPAKSLVKQVSLRRTFSDGLETEHLTDVSVNKLISRFEKQKSSSSSTESLKQNQITVEAVIESECFKNDSPKAIHNPSQYSSVLLHKDENKNLKMFQQSSVDSAMSKLQNQQSIDDIEGNNRTDKIKGGRRRSIEWLKSSKTINRTVDIPVDNNDGEIFYSFEEYEDSKHSNYNNNNDSSAMVTADVVGKIKEKNVRHVYNVSL